MGSKTGSRKHPKTSKKASYGVFDIDLYTPKTGFGAPPSFLIGRERNWLAYCPFFFSFFGKKKIDKCAVTGRSRLYYPPSGNHFSVQDRPMGDTPKPPLFLIIIDIKKSIKKSIYKKTQLYCSMAFCDYFFLSNLLSF